MFFHSRAQSPLNCQLHAVVTINSITFWIIMHRVAKKNPQVLTPAIYKDWIKSMDAFLFDCDGGTELRLSTLRCVSSVPTYIWIPSSMERDEKHRRSKGNNFIIASDAEESSVCGSLAASQCKYTRTWPCLLKLLLSRRTILLNLDKCMFRN